MEIDGETVKTVADLIFWPLKITADGDCSHEIKRHLLLGRKVMTNLDSILKSRNIILPTKVHLVESYGFSTGRVWMWKLDYKESWAPKESPLDCKEIQQDHPKGNQPWIFIERTDAETETPIFWPPDENWLIREDPDAGKDWRQEEKGMTEDEIIGWHPRLNGHEFE